MTEGAKPEGGPSSDGWQPPSWRKIGEFVSNVFQIQRSIDRLQKENRALEAEVSRLQSLVDEHNGQLKTIMQLIESTMSDRAAKHAEAAALRMVNQLLALRDMGAEDTK